MKKTFYWHDYETFGIQPGKDRASQFAGIRTDEDFNIVDKPLVIYCQPADDFLPQPEACLITGISPQLTLKQGIPEYQFFKQIHEQIALPHTCTVGYNNIRFDDEFTRFGLYRNFYDPYAREWQNSNSRWDLIDMIRLTAALRPEGIHWPRNEQNKISFRLEHLTHANGISHDNAHDALSDVHATIAMAKLIKTKQPRLYDFCLQLRNKHKVLELINLADPKPFIHISGMYPSEHGHCALVLPIMAHPTNKNGVIVYDLRYSSNALLTLNSEEIKHRLYTSTEELKNQGLERIALKTIHINKCPAVAPLSTLSAEASERLNINVEEHLKNNTHLINNLSLNKVLEQVFTMDYKNKSIQNDVDNALYSGGFFHQNDREKMNLITRTNEKDIMQYDDSFTDPRLEEMLFRYKCRNFKHLLDKEALDLWNSYRIKRMTDKNENASITFEVYKNTISKLLETEENKDNIKLLHDLEKYSKEIGLE